MGRYVFQINSLDISTEYIFEKDRNGVRENRRQLKEFTESLWGSDPGKWYQEENKQTNKQSREMFKRVEMWEFGDQIDAKEEEKEQGWTPSF